MSDIVECEQPICDGKCPNCGSSDVYGCLWHDVRSCENCGLEWKELAEAKRRENQR